MVIDDFGVNYHLIKREAILVDVPRLHMRVTPLWGQRCLLSCDKAIKSKAWVTWRVITTPKSHVGMHHPYTCVLTIDPKGV